MKLPNLTYSSNLLISAPKIDTDLLWNLSILFIGLAILYFLGVFFYRNKISSKSKKVIVRKRELSPMISEFLFLEDDATKDEKSNYIALKIEIRQLLKDSFNRRVLSEVLLDLRKDISGEAQQSLFRLYQDLGLHKDAFAKLKDWRWQIISKGILELTQMEVAESYGFITKFINDKRATIRKQAEIATVTLRHEGINYFLDTTKYKISEWQQLKLLDVIRNKEDFQPPQFKAWLTSNNKYVVLFALRLIKYYNQNDANASLTELVKHKNNQIKEEAIACIKEFNVTESLDTLKLVFWNCSINVKIAILDAIAKIGSDVDIEFLNLIDKKELNFSVKSKALSSINAISPQSIMPSKGIQDTSRYNVPDDITEAVAKMHAEKHAEISGERDDEFVGGEISEQLQSEIEEDTSGINDVDHEVKKGDVEPSDDLIEDKIMKEVVLPEEIEASSQNEEVKALYDIEVVVEHEMVLEKEISDNENISIDWNADHLNFLPIVVAEDNYNSEQESDYKYSTKPSDACKTILDLEVVFDVVPYETTISSVESTQSEVQSPLIEEFNIEELTFLPIVVDNELVDIVSTIEEVENEEPHFTNILVQYEEVGPHLPDEKRQLDTLEPTLEFDFQLNHELNNIDLPKSSIHDVAPDFKRYDTEEIRNTPVFYDVILENVDVQDPLELEVIEPYIFVADDSVTPTMDIDHTYKEQNNDEIELPIENEQFLQEIIDNLISFDSKSKEADTKIDDSYINPDWDLDEDELDFTPVSFEKDEEQAPNYIKVEKNQIELNDSEIEIPKASIPKAIFGDIEFEANTRKLLNDLEEMCDQREIPFLKELLTHEKYDLFKERINNLIDLFNHNEVKENLDDPLQPFSVFQDLFRTCDTESKLILLNEVVEVGDEKEIHFLEGLTKDDSLEIRKKAVLVLKELKSKLDKNQRGLKNQEVTDGSMSHLEGSTESKDETTLHTSKSTDIFELNFDFTKEDEENNDEKKSNKNQAVQYGSFFGQICSFSHKIMEKLNG